MNVRCEAAAVLGRLDVEQNPRLGRRAVVPVLLDLNPAVSALKKAYGGAPSRA
jgi:hypothetical protein